MPGYGGGVGGDNAPGNQGGAGGGSGAGGGYGGNHPGLGGNGLPVNMPTPDLSVFNGGFNPQTAAAMAAALGPLGLLGGINMNSGAYNSLNEQDRALVDSMRANQQNNAFGEQAGGNEMTNGAFANPAAGVVPGQFGNMADAGLYGINQAAGLYNQGYTPLQFGDMSQQSFGQVGNMLDMGQQGSGYNNRFQNLSTQVNPFLSGFQDYDAQQNQYLDSMYDQGAAKIQDSLNSQFGQAGRTNSGYHQSNVGDTLGNFATNLYGQAADRMADRSLQALTSGGSLTNQNYLTQLNAANAGQNAYQSDYDNLYNTTLMQNQFGRQQDEQVYNTANSGWDALSNYNNALATIQGTQPPDRPRSSSSDDLVGLLALYGAFS